MCLKSAAGLWIPFYDPDGKPIKDDGSEFGSLRLKVADDGHRYHQRRGTALHAYVPRNLGTLSNDFLIVVEGTFKALSLAEAESPAIGINGFNGFASEGRLVEEIGEVLRRREPKSVYFVGDNDTHFNWHFYDAALRFRSVLPEDADLHLVQVPLDQPKGVDDCRDKMGDIEFKPWWNDQLSDASRIPNSCSRERFILAKIKPALKRINTLPDDGRKKAVSNLGDIARRLSSKSDWSEHFEKFKGIVGTSSLTKEERSLIETKGLSNGEVPVETLFLQLSETAVTSTEFLKQRFPRPAKLLSPWLREGTLTEIYGKRGIGKSWLSLILSICLTREEDDEPLKIGPWSVTRPAGVLYVDGEMTGYDLMKRVELITNGLSKEDTSRPLRIISSCEFFREHETEIRITNENIRMAISEYLGDHSESKVLILDNVAALAPGLDENSKTDWDPINQWLIELRHMGIAVIFIHHSGKDSGAGQRGHSAREDALDNVFKLEKKGRDFDECCFKVHCEKSRLTSRIDNLRDFSLRIHGTMPNVVTWETETDQPKDRHNKTTHIEQVLRGLQAGHQQKEIATQLLKSEAWVTNIKNDAIKEGYLSKQGKQLTQKGKQLLEE